MSAAYVPTKPEPDRFCHYMHKRIEVEEQDRDRRNLTSSSGGRRGSGCRVACTENTGSDQRYTPGRHSQNMTPHIRWFARTMKYRLTASGDPDNFFLTAHCRGVWEQCCTDDREVFHSLAALLH